MNSSKARAVRLLTGSAAGALALGALALVPAPATAAAVPDQTRLTTAAPASVAQVATTTTAVAAKKATKTTRVQNDKQLRRAVSKANKRSGTDKIVLTSNVTLKNGGGKGNGPLKGDLDVSDDLVIRGGTYIINAKGRDRVFDVTSGIRLVLKDLTLKNGAPASGESGGAVRSTGATVIAKHVRAVNNEVTGDGASGGAFMNDDGVLKINVSSLVNNSATRAGGAIEANAGETWVDKTLMLGNSAGGAAGPGNGGAIHLSGDGKVTVDKSRADRNIAALEGGAFWNAEGGIFLIGRSTLKGNTAAGDASDNGGGALYNDGGVMGIVTSEFDDNSATGAAGSGGAILNNLGELHVENSRLGGNSANRAGGAIEAVNGNTEVLDTVMRGNSAGSAPGNGGALHVSEAGVVLVAGGRIIGNTAANEGGGLWNSATGDMEVAQVTISGNSAAGVASDNGGGGLYNDGGTMLVRGSALDSNTATGTAGSGGGILNNLGTLDVVNTTIDAGSAARAGGAIEAVGGTTTITRSSLEENTAGPTPGNGGAVHVSGAGAVVVKASSFGANTATAEGGALWNSATGTMSIERTDIVGNTASGDAADQGGGGVYTDGGDLSIVDTEIRENSADGAAGSGGGVFNNQANFDISSSSLTNNNAVRAGGGIETAGGTVTLSDVDFDGNTTGSNPGNGGGFHAGGANTVTYTGGTVSNNEAANEGGGLWCSNSGNFIATGITFDSNTAGVDGDDVYHQDPATPPTVSTCTINGTSVPQGTGTP